MKKITTLILAALTPVTAFADVTLYGRAHVSLDYLDDGANYSELNAASNSSRLGFKGKTDFGGVTAVFQLEQQIDFNRSSGETFSTRDTFVGIQGNLGLLRLGQFDSPFKRARGPADLFGDQLGDMRNLTRVGNARFDERMPNTLHYQTPIIGHLQFDLAYSLHEGDNAEVDTQDDGVSLALAYADGPLNLAVAYEAYGEDTSAGGREAVRLAGSYAIAGSVRLVAFYQTVDHDDDSLDSDLVGGGAEFTLTQKTLLRGHYLVRTNDNDDQDSSLAAVGIEHRIDSALRLYLNYAQLSNDANIALTPWNQARTPSTPGVDGETASGLSLGMRYDF